MRKHYKNLTFAVTLAVLSSLLVSTISFAANPNISSIETFIRTIINVLASLAGLVAAGFFVWGGFGYITSSGNIERLDRSKRTLLHAGLGLVIVLAAFVIANIVTSIAQGAFGS